MEKIIEVTRVEKALESVRFALPDLLRVAKFDYARIDLTNEDAIFEIINGLNSFIAKLEWVMVRERKNPETTQAT
jgi:hypothetical protein